MIGGYDRIIIKDFETNGVFSPLNQPIEVCLMIVDQDKITTYQSLIKCKYRLNNVITETTGITDEMLEKDGRDIEEVFHEIGSILYEKEKTLLVGYYNLRFDNKFMNYYLNKFWMPEWDNNNTADAFCYFKAEHCKLVRRLDETELQFQLRSAATRCEPGHTLENACAHYKIKHDGKFHRAYPDVEKTWRIFLEQINRNIPKPCFTWNNPFHQYHAAKHSVAV